MKKISVILASFLACSITLFATLPVKAEVNAQVLVRYSNRRSMSNWIPRTVKFMSGWDLSRATHNYTLDSTALYALLWFDRNQVAIIQVQEPIMTTMTFRELNFRTAQTITPLLAGYDQNGDYWEVCISRQPMLCQSF